MNQSNPQPIALLANEACIGPALPKAVAVESRSTPAVRVWLTTPHKGMPTPVSQRIKLVMN